MSPNKRTLMLLVGICGAVVLVAVTWSLLPHSTRFSAPGPKAALYNWLGIWSMEHRYPKAAAKFVAWAETAESKYLDAAVHSRRLALVQFHDYGGMGGMEFAYHASQMAESNGWRVILVRVRNPTTSPKVFDVYVEAPAEKLMQHFVHALEKAKAGSVYE